MCERKKRREVERSSSLFVFSSLCSSFHSVFRFTRGQQFSRGTNTSARADRGTRRAGEGRGESRSSRRRRCPSSVSSRGLLSLGCEGGGGGRRRRKTSSGSSGSSSALSSVAAYAALLLLVPDPVEDPSQDAFLELLVEMDFFFKREREQKKKEKRRRRKKERESSPSLLSLLVFSSSFLTCKCLICDAMCTCSRWSSSASTSSEASWACWIFLGFFLEV